jgi:hypothetical protein
VGDAYLVRVRPHSPHTVFTPSLRKHSVNTIAQCGAVMRPRRMPARCSLQQDSTFFAVEISAYNGWGGLV